MTQKKKAELQRRLSIAPVPRPPDDLAHRLKADIPDFLSTEHDRQRLSRSVAFNMRVAASILLLVTSAFVAIRLLSPQQKAGVMSVPMMATAAEEKAAAVTVTIDERRPQAGAAERSLSAYAYKKETESDTRNSVRSDETRLEDRRGSGVDVGVTAGRTQPAPLPPSVPTEERAVVADAVRRQRSLAAPRSVPPPAAPAMPPAAADHLDRVAKASADAPSRNVAESINVTASAPAVGIVSSAQAASLSFPSPRSLFDVSLNGGEFDRLKHLIESQRQPEPSSVDVEALVNHFAGAPARAPRQDVSLQAEASQSALPDSPAFLRVTIDTSAIRNPESGSAPPVARDVSLEIEIQPGAVEELSIVGNGQLKASEPVLLRGSSVTRLINLRLRPGIRDQQEVARVRLTWRNVTNGKPLTSTKIVKAFEVRRSWMAATRRHRLATLGAQWGETLKGAKGSGEQVARSAEKLSSEQPGDTRARELAAAATASSRLQNSGQTGSGR